MCTALGTRGAVIRLALLSLLSACGGDPAGGGGAPTPPSPAPPAAKLVRVDDEPRGAHCAAGGKAVREGTDANADGVLQDAEVSATTYVCAPPGTRVRLEPEPAGSNCAHGGTAVLLGPDADADGVLQDAEVSERRYVCDAPPPALLSRVDAEARGAHCVSGGKAVRSGLDLDTDGVLDAEEVTSTHYVCDVRTLTRIDVEPRGQNCAAGGAAVRTGADANGDDVLQDAEVEATRYACEHVVVGDVVLASAADVALLQEVVVITGDLKVENGPVDVALPALRALGGGVSAWSSTLRSLDLPALESVGGSLHFTSTAPALERLGVPQLRTVGGILGAAQAPQLAALALPELRSVQDLELFRTPSLTSLSAPLLSSARWVTVFEAPVGVVALPGLHAATRVLITGAGVTEVHLPQLTSVQESLVVTQVPALRTLELPKLASVEGNLFLRSTLALPQLSLPELLYVRGHLELNGHAALTTLSAPRLGALHGPASVADNPLLASLDLTGLWEAYDSFNVGNCPRLASLQGVRNLLRVGGTLRVYALPVTRLGLPNLRSAYTLMVGYGNGVNPALATLDLPALERLDFLAVSGVPALTALDLPRLRVLTGNSFMRYTEVPGALHLFDAPALPRCRVDALLGQLDAPPPRILVSGIDETGTCG